jgi:hypothetical protein
VALDFKGVGLVVTAGVAIGACHAAPLDAVSVDPASLSTGLVAHWSFDEGTGTVVGDHSGNGHDGTLTMQMGSTWLAEGRFGGALELGYGDSVAVPNFPQATPNWTISVWIRASSAQLAQDAGDTGTILSTEQVFSGGWQLHLDNRPAFQRFDAAYWSGPANNYLVDSCNCIAAGEWFHLTAVFDDDARTFTLYEGVSPVAQTNLPTTIQAGDSTLYMGKWYMMNSRLLAADLDDFAIWSRALTSGDIAVLSQQPPPD